MRGSAPNTQLPFTGMTFVSDLHAGVRYRLEHFLGQGGTAVAYLATRLASDGESPAVVKIIQPRLVVESNETALTIIKKEAVALGRLNEQVPPTPHVVRLMDTGSTPYEYFARKVQLPWIALEYVHGGGEGSTLEARVDYSVKHTGFAFDPERAARVIDGLARGLSEIHSVGVVHRDLTPGNVLCCGSGDAELYKISDFGIARPAGLAATFGDAIVGTPGYVAPEQLGGSAPVSVQSDIFSLAAIVYFLLTGQRYFEVTSPTQALVAVGTPQRRTLAEAATLSPELREREASCQAIDLALSRATSPSASERPRSATQFSQSLLPWLVRDSAGARPSRRWVTSMDLLQTEPEVSSSWVVRHPPGNDRLLTSVAWLGSGHCLAVSTHGLVYWDGTHWAAVPTETWGDLGPVRFVRRLTATSWLLGTERGALVEYSRSGLRELARLPGANLELVDAHGELGDLAVIAATDEARRPVLVGHAARRFMRPMPIEAAAAITGVARIDDESWLVIGRSREARCYAAVYRPLDWLLEPITPPDGRALVAVASRPERRLAVAVGTDGSIVRVERDKREATNVDGRPDLAAVAIDVVGNEWAAGAGSIWANRAHRGWKRIWENATWRPPFISLLAESGMVVAVTVDSGVLESRSLALDKTRPG